MPRQTPLPRAPVSIGGWRIRNPLYADNALGFILRLPLSYAGVQKRDRGRCLVRELGARRRLQLRAAPETVFAKPSL